MIYRSAVRPALFAVSRGDPERAHTVTLRELSFISRHRTLLNTLAFTSRAPDDGRGREVFGIRFPGPLGVAAGFDKNGIAIPALGAMGFGFVEAGTVTEHAQPGHPRPRTWRFPRDESLVNAMGFPNRGAAAVARYQTIAERSRVPVGWNVSKSMVTALDDAAADVCASIRKLHRHADFFVINVSSPNTPGLRALEERDRLDSLVAAAQAQLRALGESAGAVRPRPLLIKISPDLSDAAMDDVVAVSLDRGVAGIVATNTTLRRELAGPGAPDRGGLSGKLLRPRSLDVVRYLVKALEGRLPVVGVGGVGSVDDARRMLDAGASLIQAYTGLIYAGPRLVRDVNAQLRDGWLRG